MTRSTLAPRRIQPARCIRPHRRAIVRASSSSSSSSSSANHLLRRLVATTLLSLAVASGLVPSSTALVDPVVVDTSSALSLEDQRIADVYKKVDLSVATIFDATVAGQLAGTGAKQEGNGSGIVYDTRGTVVTNYHVLAKAVDAVGDVGAGEDGRLAVDEVAVDEGILEKGRDGVDVVLAHLADVFEKEGEGLEHAVLDIELCRPV